jgi:hypothetical protein
MILEKSYEHIVDSHQLYIGYKQAYGSINRDQLIEIMKEFGIPSKLIVWSRWNWKTLITR